jgi:hypothetical protein
MQSSTWAPEHSQALREYLAKGMSYSEIGCDQLEVRDRLYPQCNDWARQAIRFARSRSAGAWAEAAAESQDS